ncbi:MAG: hypothetical protein WD773_11705 [Gemmatimonadales bacterium]
MDAAAAAAACIPNIGPRERRQQLRFGVIAFGVRVAIGALLVATGELLPPAACCASVRLVV